jgi:hypothetical protein
VLAAVALAATGCSNTRSKTLYHFVDLPVSLPVGQTNLIGNPSFESPFRFCNIGCNTDWSEEYTTAGAPDFHTSSAGRVSGQLAETIEYKGRQGDDGKTGTLDRAVELYQSVQAGDATTAGQMLTFTLWVSGDCGRCAPFIGIEAFDTRSNWLGEEDQYFQVPNKPTPVEVSWVLPAGTTRVAALLQVPEIYRITQFDVHVDNAWLVSRKATPREAAAAMQHPQGNG